jgi:folate-binding protein YgfZ
MARTVLRIGGADRVHFLQGLVTNDLKGLADGLVYAAILTPQGKYLADFFLKDDGDAVLLDADAGPAAALAQRLAMYRLRAAVTIADTGLAVRRGTGPAPEGALPDPRHPALGWRLYGRESGDDGTDFDALRVAHCIPESGIELIPNETFILEAGFERLHGVDFRKGCYVGQEVTARMKHKTELRKGLATVEVDGTAPVGTPLVTADGKEAGALYTQSHGRGIAYLRFDRADGPLSAGSATVRLAAQAPAA